METLPGEPILRTLIISIVALFVSAVSLALFVLAEHAYSQARAVRSAALEKRWRTQLQDVLAGDADPASLLALVDAHERWHFAEYLAEFAARLKGEELAMARQVAAPSVRGVASMVSEGSVSSRAKHVRVTALLGGPAYVSHVVAALASRASLVSATAVRWLCRPEYSTHARDVIARLSRFEQWSPRFLGVLLARFGPDAAEPLRALLESGAAEPERVGAARALWWIKDADSADSAGRVLSSATAPWELAESCLRLIERCGTERHAAVARPWCDHADGRVRAAAVAALCVVGTAADAPRALAGISDVSAEVALEAAHALARTRRPEVERLSREGGPREAAIAREALAT